MTKKKKIIICGQSDAGYPRDETLMAAIVRIPNLRIFDLRFIRQDGFFLKYNIVQRIIKKTLIWRIFGLINVFRIDAIFIMKLNQGWIDLLYGQTNRKNIPIIYDLWVSRYIMAQRDNKDIDYWFRKEKEIIEKCSYLICTTKAYKTYYSETFSCHPDKLFVVPLAVEQEWLDIPLPKKTERNTINIAYWGNFLKQHGVDIALQAAKILQNEHTFQFFFMGKVNKSVIDLSEYENLKNIRFLPFTGNRKELVNFIDQMDISFGHLKPIHDAHLMLPNKALEGMARGKSVIHIDTILLCEEYTNLANENLAVVFFTGSAQHLAQKILELKEKTLRSEISKQAKKKIREIHSVENVTSQLVELLDKI